MDLNLTKGLKPKRFDLHVHTPASDCFLDKGVTLDDIVQKALDMGLSAIAITDHNTGEWVDGIKSAAEGKPLVVFPGAEITCSDAHIHVISIMDVVKTSQDIEDLLLAVGIKRNSFGQKDAFSPMSVNDVVNKIHEHGGLAVLAHADSSNGAIDNMQGHQRINVIQNNNLSAIEIVDYEKSKQFFDGTDPNYKRKIALYQSSDNPALDDSGEIITSGEHSGKHTLGGISYRYSIFKVDEVVNLESLYQCFNDPDVRIKVPSEFVIDKYQHISKLEIKGGFFDGATCNFHEGLNTIIGAKGAGKSLLVEFMRFALEQESSNTDILEDHRDKLAERLELYGTVRIARRDHTGAETIYEREYNPVEGNPYKQKSASSAKYDFPIIFLSQNEIIKIAESEEEQIKFIDKFLDFKFYQAAISDLEAELKNLDSELTTCIRAYHREKMLRDTINAEEVELLKINKQLSNPTFKRFSKIEKKELSFKRLDDLFSHILGTCAEFKEAAKAVELPQIEDEVKDDPAIKRAVGYSVKAKEVVAAELDKMEQELGKLHGKLSAEYEKWSTEYISEKERYEKVVGAGGGDAKALEVKRKEKLLQIEQLKKKQLLYKAKIEQLRQIAKKREDKLDSLEETYKKYFSERRKKCEMFERESAGRLKIDIRESENVNLFRDTLTEKKKRSHLKNDEISNICGTVSSKDFIRYILNYDLTPDKKYIEKVAEMSGVKPERIKILYDHLLKSMEYEELLELQYKAYPQDRPEIKYNIGSDRYENLKKVSVGQKCTAMIIMALCEGNIPIVIDQPEDSLDIRTIWEDMCSKLRKGKEKRQFIFTTHNSSLAVASDTDKYVVLEADAHRGNVVFSGAIDNQVVREEVIKYLEGGKNTYKAKYRKYHLGPEMLL